MKCMYESAHDPYYKRVQQVDASNIDFLSRLCHDAGISLKATSSMIVLFDQAAYEAKSPVITIQKGNGVFCGECSSSSCAVCEVLRRLQERAKQ